MALRMSTSPNASTIGYSMSQHDDCYKFFVFSYFDSKKAQVKIETNAETGRGKLVITGPKDKESGKKHGGVIVLPKGADLKSQLTIDNKKGLYVSVPKLPEFVTSGAA